MRKVKIGVIGCGKISGIYLKNCTEMFEQVEVVAVADLVPELAARRAQEFNIPHVYSLDQLYDDPQIELILNLTSPAAHALVNKRALEAGKHVYCEKPFALTAQDAQEVLSLAESKGLRVGCAPDTFLGAGAQTCRKLIDDGWIGKPYAVNGTIIMGSPSRGTHPNFENFLKLGGDPLMDMGTYYLTAMVNMLGPVRRVTGSAQQLNREITIQNPKSHRYGDTVPIEAPMHVTATLDFEAGVVGSLQAAKESFGYTPRLEVYGTEGILYAPDPNMFGGSISIKQHNGEIKEFPYSHGFSENSRGLGVADLAQAILSGRAHRASGQLASHILDVSLGIFEASETNRHVLIQSRCERPAPLPLGLKYNMLDD